MITDKIKFQMSLICTLLGEIRTYYNIAVFIIYFQPSSSSRAVEFLQQEGQTGFIGFSNLSGNSLGYVPQPKSDESELDADLRLLLRKMTKKDTITRLKVFF